MDFCAFLCKVSCFKSLWNSVSFSVSYFLSLQCAVPIKLRFMTIVVKESASSKKLGMPILHFCSFKGEHSLMVH
jgi:hypothetical protein